MASSSSSSHVHGDTLSAAAYAGDLPRIEALLAAGASPTAKDDDARRPLHWAAAGGHVHVIAHLLRLPGVAEACVGAADDEGFTPLVSAAAGGHVGALAVLLAAGAPAHAPTSLGTVALHYHKGRADVVEALLGAGGMVDVDARDRGGLTPLHRAAAPGFLDATRALLAGGAAPNAADKLGRTPLHLACEEGACVRGRGGVR